MVLKLLDQRLVLRRGCYTNTNPLLKPDCSSSGHPCIAVFITLLGPLYFPSHLPYSPAYLLSLIQLMLYAAGKQFECPVIYVPAHLTRRSEHINRGSCALSRVCVTNGYGLCQCWLEFNTYNFLHR